MRNVIQYRRREPENWQELIDLDAEFRLRGFKAPEERIPDVLKAMFEEVRRLGPDNPPPNLGNQVAEFLGQRDRIS